jgi:hypothetical protein
LGDAEETHYDLQEFVKRVGELEIDHLIRGNQREYRTSYKIPAEHKDRLEGQMDEVIDAINQKNRKSKVLQYLTYSILFFSTLAVIGLFCFLGLDPRGLLVVL